MRAVSRHNIWIALCSSLRRVKQWLWSFRGTDSLLPWGAAPALIFAEICRRMAHFRSNNPSALAGLPREIKRSPPFPYLRVKMAYISPPLAGLSVPSQNADFAYVMLMFPLPLFGLISMAFIMLCLLVAIISRSPKRPCPPHSAGGSTTQPLV